MYVQCGPTICQWLLGQLKYKLNSPKKITLALIDSFKYPLRNGSQSIVKLVAVANGLSMTLASEIGFRFVIELAFY